MSKKRIVEDRTIADLAPNPKNPRRITHDQREKLARSLKEMGDLGGIIFNRRTGHLIGGHRRSEELPADAKVIITDRFEKVTLGGTVAEGYVEAWGERFKYREVDWDEGKEKIAMLGANKLGGEWDIPLIEEVFLDIERDNLDIDLTGFSTDEIHSLLADGTDTPPPVNHTDTHSFTFSIRCHSDEEIIRIREFFGVLKSGCDFSDFEQKCL